MIPSVNGEIKELELKKIDVLIESANESAKRVRQIFVVTLVASVVIFIAVFNTYFSWMRHVNPSSRFSYSLKHNFLIKPPTDDSASLKRYYLAFDLKTDTLINHSLKINRGYYAYNEDSLNEKITLMFKDSLDMMKSKMDSVVLASLSESNENLVFHANKRLIDNYFERQYINIPILGIKVTTHDLPILASICILIFLVWHYYSSRREYRIIREIEKVHKKGPIWISKSNSKYRSIDFSLKEYILQGIIHKFIFISASSRDINPLERILLNTLYYVPFFVMKALIIGEIFSILFVSDFTFENLLTDYLAYSKDNLNLFRKYWIEQIYRYSIMIIATYFSFKIIKNIRVQTKDTAKIFSDMLRINETYIVQY